jgi:hypothetical protein
VLVIAAKFSYFCLLCFSKIFILLWQKQLPTLLVK